MLQTHKQAQKLDTYLKLLEKIDCKLQSDSPIG